MQNVSDIPQSPRWNTIPTQSHRPPSKKKEERTTRFQSPVVTDERTDGQTRRVAAPLICAAPPRHAGRRDRMTTPPGQPAAGRNMDAAAAVLGVVRPGRP